MMKTLQGGKDPFLPALIGLVVYLAAIALTTLMLVDAAADFAHQAAADRRLIDAIEGLMVLVLFLLASTLFLAVRSTTQTFLTASNETVSLLHLLGADDRPIIDVIVLRALRAALLGGLIGAALFAFSLAAFSQVADAASSGFSGNLLRSPTAWVLIAATPLATAAVAALSAWLVARRCVDDMP